MSETIQLPPFVEKPKDTASLKFPDQPIAPPGPAKPGQWETVGVDHVERTHEVNGKQIHTVFLMRDKNSGELRTWESSVPGKFTVEQANGGK